MTLADPHFTVLGEQEDRAIRFFAADGTEALVIENDGTLRLGANVTADEAALVFVEAVNALQKPW